VGRLRSKEPDAARHLRQECPKNWPALIDRQLFQADLLDRAAPLERLRLGGRRVVVRQEARV